MEQFHLLILLSLGMLIGSYLSGTVPMAFKLSDNKSRLLALMGSGILVGTALAIIIPEGINSIYSRPSPIVVQPANGDKVPMTLVQPEPPIESWVIGIWLVAGFVLMLLIDQFSIYQGGGGNHPDTAHTEYTLTNQDDNHDEDDGEVLEYGRFDVDLNESELTSETKPIRDTQSHCVSMGAATNHHQPNSARHRRAARSGLPVHRAAAKVTPTLGLVIHAAADGIALGAAATTSHRDVEMIIFLAIMLHKAPAAFSLVVFLLHRGLRHTTIRRHLLAFSLSAPLAALLTFFGLSQSGKEALRQNNATGIAMLFSAGTFLYVATVHVMPELVHNRLLKPRELVFLVGGAFLPILLAEAV